MVTISTDGRLGNICTAYYTLFHYCKFNSIPYDNIKLFYEYNLSKDNEYLKEALPLFQNFKNNFSDIKQEKLHELTYNELKTLKLKDNFKIIGYDWEYTFDSDLILKLFYPKDIIINLLKDNLFHDNSTVGVHIRRCDFVNHKIFSKYVLSPDRIINIIDNILNQNKIPVIFSDDIDYIYSIIDKKKLWKSVCMSKDLAYLDMLRLSLCDEIVTNEKSSYSYFAEKLLLSRKEKYQTNYNLYLKFKNELEKNEK